MSKKQFEDISLIILAGGKSRRMGANKALLKYRGKSFIEILFGRFKDLFSEIIISSDNSQVYLTGTKIVPDVYKNIGPVGGIYSALMFSEIEKNIVISVDTPFISKDLIRFLIKNDDKNSIVTIISEKKHLHPLIGIYSKKFTYTLKNEILSENYKLRNIILKTKYKIAEISEENFYNEKLLQNINTPESYYALSKKE